MASASGHSALNSHGPITDRLATIIWFSISPYLNRKCRLLLQRIVIQYGKPVSRKLDALSLWMEYVNLLAAILTLVCLLHHCSWPVRPLWWHQLGCFVATVSTEAGSLASCRSSRRALLFNHDHNAIYTTSEVGWMALKSISPVAWYSPHLIFCSCAHWLI